MSDVNVIMEIYNHAIREYRRIKMDRDTRYVTDFIYTLKYIKDEFPFEPYFQFIPDKSDNTIEVYFNILSAKNTEIINNLFDQYNEIYGKMFDNDSHNFHTSYSRNIQEDEIIKPIVQEYGEMALVATRDQLNMKSITEMYNSINLSVSFMTKMKSIFNDYIIDDKTFTSRLNILLKEIEEPFYIDLYLMLKRLQSYDFYTNTIYLMKEKKARGQSIILDSPYSSTYIFSDGGVIND